MISARRVLVTAVTAAAMTVGGVAFTSPAWADAQACGLGADNPNSNNDGTGSRSGCSGTVTLTVLVNKDVSLLPDPTAGVISRSGFLNGSLMANGDCSHGRGSYYTETRSSSGNKIQSGRVTRC